MAGQGGSSLTWRPDGSQSLAIASVLAVIPLAVPDVGGLELKYLTECITSSYVSSVGPFVGRFEEQLCTSTGSDFAVATSSGTSALHLALMAVGTRPGDLVVLPSYTFIASANAIRHAGADPWLLDISSESWTLDPSLLDLCLTRDCMTRDGELFHQGTNRRVAAIMPVYAVGHPADMNRINEIASSFSLPVVADAAGSIGARYRDRPLGHLATVSVLSFNGNKTVTTGGGGALLTNDAEVADYVRHVSTTARRGPAYEHDAVAFNYRMTNVEAAIGCAQLERLADFLSTKSATARHYRDSLTDLAWPFPSAEWAQPSHWLSGIVLPNEFPGQATEFAASMQTAGVDARTFWIPMHLQPPYRDCISSPMPVADALWNQVVTLPCSSGISDSDREKVVQCARQTFGGANA